MKRIFAGAFALALAAIPAAAETIKVGVTAGPHAEIMEKVKEVAAKDGLDIKIVEFSDYIQPNAALVAGDLDANSFQHQPYLDNIVRDRGYKIVSIAKTVIFPIGLYSKKIKSLDQVANGARIALPNDPTNGGRVLLLLQEKGLIKVKPEAGLKATPLDVTDNPKKLKFVELDAAQLPRSVDDVEVAAINTNFAISAGLVPARDAIAMESADSPYANVIAVMEKDKDKPAFKTLVKAYHSDTVRNFIAEKFKGSVGASF